MLTICLLNNYNIDSTAEVCRVDGIPGSRDGAADAAHIIHSATLREVIRTLWELGDAPGERGAGVGRFLGRLCWGPGSAVEWSAQ